MWEEALPTGWHGSLGTKRPGQFGDRGQAVAPAIVLETGEGARPNRWVDEVHGADLHRSRTGDDELERIRRRCDATHPDDRDLDRLGGLIDESDRDGTDRRARKPAHPLRQPGAPPPADPTRRAPAAMSVTLGLSLGITGRRVPARTISVTRAAKSGSQPNSMPPSLTFGQEMLISMPLTPSTSFRMRASSPYSSSVLPQILTRMAGPRPRSSGNFPSMNRLTPISCSPMALSIPEGVSQMRGGGQPGRGFRYSPLTTIAPRAE